ncbi:MAG: ribosome recycling factor [Candidatus Omnitrophica bacterium]|nr:ribosome recycling factor [Candidatus Omnitrophota bacterium]
MGVKDILAQSEEKMKKTIEATIREFGMIRTGRASPALLDGIKVDYYGTMTPVKQLAAVSAPEARMIVIQPWDPSVLAALEKAILKSELGITPQNDGKIIRLSIPPLNKERRAELVKVVNKQTEEGRVAIRSIRREANEQFKQEQKATKITEDESFKGQETVQKLTDKYIKQLDDLLKQKETEIMEV